MMTYRSSYNPTVKADYSNFAFKKSEILEVLKGLNSNFSFEQHEPKNVDESIYFEDEQTCREATKYPLFFKNKTFSIHEATCLMSDYKPTDTIWDYENLEWLRNNPKYEEASNFIFSAVRTDLFQEFSNGEYFITSDHLKALLTESGHYINGFNDKEFANLSNENLAENTQLKNTIASLQLDVAIEQVTVKELNEEIEKLKAELLEKDERIKEPESIQTSQDESKLGNTRAENNVAKLLLVLAKMANIDINKPHAVHESLLVQAELLGVDKFPSDETIKKWLIKANRHGNNQNPN